MSWSAHQFESYVLQRHLGSRVRISYLALVTGDLLPDAFTKVWVYGVTVRGRHYGAGHPADFHRSWPGAGFTHSLALGALAGALVWWLGRHRAWGVPWGIGVVVGQWAHAITDVNDSKGTMLLFPFTTHDFALGTWAYGAQVGKHEDAAAYFSSLGFVMDVGWLLVLLLLARDVLGRAYFRSVVEPADPRAWAWLERHVSPEGALAVYRCLFSFAVARLISWSVWAHAVDPHPWDLSWGGPDWLRKVPPSHQSVSWVVVGVAGVGVALVLLRLVLRRHRLPTAADEVPLPTPRGLVDA
jgi:membrane-bound metal-dependent hydrolase YbcI (DUF457 family)